MVRPKKKTAAAPAEAEMPLSERAHRSLMEMILNGHLGPNEVVTERQIALQLGISRTPLREAVRRLEGAKMLHRQKSGALVVRSLPIEEYMHILNVRRLLEGEAARLAAGKVPQAELDAIRSRIDAVLSLPEDAPLPVSAPDDEDLHRVIAAASANPVLEEMIATLRTRTAMFRFGRLPGRRKVVMQEHRQVVDALASGDGEAARKAMDHHIDQVRATILARLSGN